MVSMAQKLYNDGKLERELKGMVKVLLIVGTKKFGAITTETTDRLKTIADPAVLEDLGSRLLDVQTWEELLAGLHSKVQTTG